MSAIATWIGFTPASKPRRVQQWSSIKLFDEVQPWLPDCVKKVVSLCELERDWDTYDSDRISPPAIRKAIVFLLEVSGEAIPEPSVSPVPGGGVGLHWRVHDRDLEIEFLPDGRVEYLKTKVGVSVNAEEGALEDFRDVAIWTWLSGAK